MVKVPGQDRMAWECQPRDCSAADRFFGLHRNMLRDKFSPRRLQMNGASWFTSETALNQYDRADFQNVDLRIAQFAGRLVMRLRKTFIPMFVHNAFRTKEEQQRLFDKGVSKVVFPEAAHCQGKAVDIVHGVFGWEMNKTEWQYIGNVGKEEARKLGIEVTWGGDWKRFYDPAHWELKGWQDDVKRSVPFSDPLRLCPAVLARGR